MDASGDAYVAGQTGSTDFPVTPGAFQESNLAAASGFSTAFITKLNPTGTTLIYSTYLGGSGSDSTGDAANAIAVDSGGNAYVAGQTGSTDFPVTAGAYQTTNHSAISFTNAFVTKLNPAGTALIYSTYLGGSGGTTCSSATLYQKAGDEANGLAIDGAGDAYIAGATASTNFPVTSGAYQSTNLNQIICGGPGVGDNAFITELNSKGSSLVYSTYLGGSGINPGAPSPTGVLVYGPGDQATAVALDSSNNVYVAGLTSSADFPVTAGAFQTVEKAAMGDAFIAKLETAGTFTITGTAVTVEAGATEGNTSTVTVAPSGGFTGSVALTAGLTSSPSGAQDLPTLSFGSTSPVNITGSAAGTAVLTISTTAPVACSESYRERPGGLWYSLGAVLLAGLLLAGIMVTRRRTAFAIVVVLAVLTLVTAGFAGCAAGGSGSSPPPCTLTPGTTAGIYTITVTGASGSTTATGSVTLTVQ